MLYLKNLNVKLSDAISRSITNSRLFKYKKKIYPQKLEIFR